jgi:hypothetical protein
MRYQSIVAYDSISVEDFFMSHIFASFQEQFGRLNITKTVGR